MDGITKPDVSDFQRFFEGAPGLYLVLDPGLYIVAVSDAYLRATMTNRPDIMGRHLFDVFPDNPDDPGATGESNLGASLKTVLASKQPNTMAVQKYDIRRPDSEGGGFEVRYWSPVNTPLLNAAGDITHIIHRVEDVSEFIRLKQEGAAGLQRMEAEIFERAQEVQAANHRLDAANQELAALRRQSEEKSALLMATARDAKFVLDDAGAVVEVNGEVERMLALPANRIVGRPLTDFIPDLCAVDGLRVARPGGGDIFIDVASAPVPIGDGSQSLFVAREVTDRVKLESQLRQSQKLEAVGQLTGGVAHDFNNLLTVISTTSEMLSERVASDASLTALVSMIEKAADRGAKLTHRMLAFARRQPLQPRSIDLNDIVAGMGMMLGRTLGEDILLSTSTTEGLWPVLADASQIEDALLNLCINARDAMPKGGQIVIQTDNTHIGPDDAALSPDLSAGDYVALVVSDTGQGMSAEVAARAIEPFFTTKGVGEGTGLGLSMVYGFVKQSHGHMVIYSELGFGTSVKLFLPRAPEGAAAARDEAAADIIGGRGETILVVEDDVDVRTVAIALLRGLGYKVRAAKDGPSALHVLREHDDIDLLFTDLMMPGGMSGIDLLHAARQDRPSLKVLLTSGYPAQVIEKRGAAGAGARLLGKPYRKRELARAIRAAIDTPAA